MPTRCARDGRRARRIVGGDKKVVRVETLRESQASMQSAAENMIFLSFTSRLPEKI